MYCTCTAATCTAPTPTAAPKGGLGGKWDALLRASGWRWVAERAVGSSRLIVVEKPGGSRQEYSEKGLRIALSRLAGGQVPIQAPPIQVVSRGEVIIPTPEEKAAGEHPQKALLARITGQEIEGCSPGVLHREFGAIQAIARKTGDQVLYNLVYQVRGLFFRVKKLTLDDQILVEDLRGDFREGTLNSAVTLALRRASGM